MKQYHIFHTIIQSRFPERKIQARKYAGFVNATSLEEAFQLSQNFELPWNIYTPCRSTSVGDVIQDDNKFYMVCGTGFEELIEPKEDLATLADKQEESKYQQ